MKFTLAGDRPAFSWPVKVKVPLDGGKFREDTFTGRFVACPRSVTIEHIRKESTVTQRRIEVAKSGAAVDDILAIADHDAEQATIREFFVGWGEDLVDGEGNPLPYSEEAREQLIDIPFVRRAIQAAYIQAMSGEARAKN